MSSSKLVKSEMESGNSPFNWLLLRSSLLSCVKFPISSEIVPLKLFEYKFKYLNLGRFPIVGGIEPSSWFPDISKLSSCFKFPISSGIVPAYEIIIIKIPTCKVTIIHIPIVSEGILPLKVLF